jgi:hypothetical protein
VSSREMSLNMVVEYADYNKKHETRTKEEALYFTGLYQRNVDTIQSLWSD